MLNLIFPKFYGKTNIRLDLSVEALVLRSEYGELFTFEERDACRNSLKHFGYENLAAIAHVTKAFQGLI
jgi:hypothetical protein